METQMGTANRHQAFIRFKNNTHFSVEVIWMNVDNTEETYSILGPQNFLDVNTYSIHSWIFREYVTKTQMVVAGQEIFMARPWIEEHKRLKFNHPVNVPLRTKVLIEMPVMDLRQLCLLQLANTLKTKNDLTELELPKILIKELSQMISNKDELTDN